MKKRVTYRPSKAQSILGMVMGGVFVLLGVTVVIPGAGPFGVLWTLMALGITIVNGIHAFSGRYLGPQITIEDDQAQSVSTASTDPVETDRPRGGDPKARLEQLNSLKDAGLISREEYDRKRDEILEEI